MVAPLTQVPAICDRCRKAFPAGIDIENSSVQITGGKSGPCPHCGWQWGSIPDGLYQFYGESRSILSTWSPERLQLLASELRAARERSDRRAAEAALGKDANLYAVASRLLIPRDAGQFWAFIAVLIALLVLLQGEQKTTVPVTPPPATARPPAQRTRPKQPMAEPPAAANKPPPPPPRKQHKKGKRKGKR
jgi:hypothetical protein